MRKAIVSVTTLLATVMIGIVISAPAVSASDQLPVTTSGGVTFDNGAVSTRGVIVQATPDWWATWYCQIDLDPACQ